MKKIIGVFAFAIIACAVFVNNSQTESSKKSGVDLASLISISIANAETDYNGCRKEDNHSCLNGTNTLTGCDESSWWEIDNCVQ